MAENNRKNNILIIILVALIIITVIVGGIAIAATLKKDKKNEKTDEIDSSVSEIASESEVSNSSSEKAENETVLEKEEKTSQVTETKKPVTNSQSATSKKEENTAPAIKNTDNSQKVTKVYFSEQYNLFGPRSTEDKSFMDDASGYILPYRLILPKDYDPKKEYPVLFYLHGAGERGNDNVMQLSYFHLIYSTAGDFLSNAITICPQCPQNGWWEIDRDYYGDQKGWLGAAMRLLESIKSEYSCDSNRVYVTGLSMGGYATWSVLERYGNVFAAGVPICGWGDTSYGAQLAQIPIWIYHGTADDTVSFTSSQVMYDSIKNAGGGKVKFTRLYGVGHDAWNDAFTDREMFCWLFAQNKKNNSDCNYDYVPYFRVVSDKNETIIDETYINSIDYVIESDGETVEIALNDDGVQRLKAAYSKSIGKEFTVYYGCEKLYSFKVNGQINDNIFRIKNVFKTNAYNFYRAINKAII